MSYNIIDYGRMINDSIRTGRYASALKKSVKSDSAVLDIGTGTGIFAQLACKLGARKVYAVETNPVIDIARKIAIDSGFDDRIELIQSQADEIKLPEKVDIIVSDMRGVLPLLKNNIRTIINLRNSYLKNDGMMIPSKDTIYAALVKCPKVYEDYSKPWLNNNYNLDMGYASKFATNTIIRRNFAPSHLLTAKKKAAEIKYSDIDTENIDSELAFKCNKSGITHGFIMWFDAELLKGIKYSNAPGKERLTYGGQMFFPFEHPVSCKVGDIIKIRIGAKNINGEYIWTWNTKFLGKSGFNQSSFLSSPITKSSISKLSADFIPKLSREGKFTEEALSMFGKKSITGISKIILKRYPNDFKTLEESIEFVRGLSYKYSTN